MSTAFPSEHENEGSAVGGFDSGPTYTGHEVLDEHNEHVGKVTDVIYDDPVRVALLQTGGLLLGGWLLVAAMRASAAKSGKKMAGYWVYVDSLHLYEAYREQVTVTPIEDVVEANFTHNYNNNKYQNSVVRIILSGNNVAQVTLNKEQRAEQMGDVAADADANPLQGLVVVDRELLGQQGGVLRLGSSRGLERAEQADDQR